MRIWNDLADGAGLTPASCHSAFRVSSSTQVRSSTCATAGAMTHPPGLLSRPLQTSDSRHGRARWSVGDVAFEPLDGRGEDG
jgi:hypothetical protein